MNSKPGRSLFVPAMTLVFAACTPGAAEKGPATPAPPEVTTAMVAEQEIRDWADFTGRLEAVESVEVRARVAGLVESVHFTEGGRVAAGNLLFQIDARPFQAEVDRLAAERERARAELTLAKKYSERAERLLERNATSQEEAEKLVSDAAVAASHLAAVSAALEAAELDLSFTRVTAPINGIVSSAVVTAGNLVDSSTLLTTLVSDDPVYAYFDMDEQTYLELVQGRDERARAAVHVGLINEEGYPHAARLDFVDNQVHPEHGTIRARAVLDNSAREFTPGLFARLRLMSPKKFRAALVDDRAIGTDLGRKFVYVVDEAGVVQYRSVETGRSIDGLRLVTAGLMSGDVVIVNGVQRVRPGVPVAATRVPMSRDSRGMVARLAEPDQGVSTEQDNAGQSVHFTRNAQ